MKVVLNGALEKLVNDMAAQTGAPARNVIIGALTFLEWALKMQDQGYKIGAFEKGGTDEATLREPWSIDPDAWKKG
jgi:hypothetical protein